MSVLSFCKRRNIKSLQKVLTRLSAEDCLVRVGVTTPGISTQSSKLPSGARSCCFTRSTYASLERRRSAIGGRDDGVASGVLNKSRYFQRMLRPGSIPLDAS